MSTTPRILPGDGPTGVTSLAIERPMEVCVVGAGYVGLTAAACLAELGHTVRCLEANPARLAVLGAGQVPIIEPGLAELVATNSANGRLTFTDDVAAAVAGAEVALLCVGTPPREDGQPDLRQLAAATRAAAAAATGDLLLVVKSTVPPGACEALELLAEPADPKIRVRVASNPEFLRESQAVWDFFHPDRVVIGVDGPELGRLVAGLYPSDWPTVICDRRSAELVKYAANTFLAVKISFANEIAALCQALGADSERVLAGVGLDSRIGPAFLRPGPGYGGSCLPKDVSGLAAVAESVGLPATLARATMRVNDQVRDDLVANLEATVGGLRGARIGVLGLAFKPGTDDIRHSPAVGLVQALIRAGARVRVHDPLVAWGTAPGERVQDPYAVAEDADALVVATAWPLYGELSSERLQRAMRGRVVLDAVGIVDAQSLADCGLHTYGVGGGRPLVFHPVVWRPLQWTLDDAGSMVA
jgi:UDPglucose 6-dehydrogenase